MTESKRNPHPETSAPVTDRDLEAQIVAAEAAVIRRDERIRRRAHSLVHRTRREIVRHAGSGLAVAAGAGLVTWWLGRRHPHQPAPNAPPPDKPTIGEHFVREAGLSIASLLPLLWPYLPRNVRRTVTPGTASSVLAVVAPLFARLFRRRRRAA
jgi:hypothetical protein